MASDSLRPIYGQTKQITVGVASAAVVLTDSSTEQVILTNVGVNLIYVRVGTVAASAVLLTDFPVLPNAAIVITREQSQVTNGAQVQTFVSAIAAAAGNTLHISPFGD